MKTRFTTAISLMFVIAAGGVMVSVAQDKPQDSTQAASQPAAEPAAVQPAPQKAPEAKSEGKFYGKVFADWNYDVTQKVPASQGIYNEKSLFELTRVYMGYNYKFNDNFTTDALLDVARVDPLTSATLATSATGVSTLSTKINDSYIAYVKTAYVAWKNIFPTGTLSFGQIPYFAFDVMESFWAHRYIYKTLMDQNGYASSADLGAKLLVNPIDMLKITVGLTDGAGYKANHDAYGDYKVAGALQLNPVKDLTLYVYGDFMPERKNTSDSAQKTIAAFVGYKILDMAKIGLEYDNQLSMGGVDGHDVNGVSVYGMYNIMKELEFLLRFDLESSKSNWSATDEQTIITGLQYCPVSKVKLALDYQRVKPRINSSTAGYYTTAYNKVFVNGEFDY